MFPITLTLRFVKFGLLNNKKITFIINPISGTVKGKLFEEDILSFFPINEHSTELIYTKHRGHGSELAKPLKDKAVTVVVIGGDGSVNEVAKELINSKTASLGIVPMGSGNGLARTLGLPLDLNKALQRIKDGSRIEIDTCSFNKQPFFCTAGIAFDAAVAKDFDELPTRGVKTYFQASYRQFLEYKNTRVRINMNNQSFQEDLFLLTIANAEQYGYGAKISPNSSLTDGLMELVLVKDLSLAQFTEFTLRLFSGSIHKLKEAQVIKSSESIFIQTDSKIAHLDGEPIEFNGEAEVNIHPKSLGIIS